MPLFQNSVVGVAGCGGLGSNAAMALTRAGVGTLILADFDVVEESNLNQQYYFHSDIGKPKVRALASHLRAVNPDIEIITRIESEFLKKTNIFGVKEKPFTENSEGFCLYNKPGFVI